MMLQRLSGLYTIGLKPSEVMTGRPLSAADLSFTSSVKPEKHAKKHISTSLSGYQASLLRRWCS